MQWFLREPLEHRQRDITLLTHLVDDVKKRMAEGTSPDCLTTQTILEQEKSGMSDLEVAYAVSSPFGAGIETVCVKVVGVGCEPLFLVADRKVSDRRDTLCLLP